MNDSPDEAQTASVMWATQQGIKRGKESTGGNSPNILMTMKPLPRVTTDKVIELLDLHHTTHAICSELSVSARFVSKVRKAYCPMLAKAMGGRPWKLTEADVCRSMCLITSGEADTAVQVAKILQDTTNMVVSAQTICWSLKVVGLKARAKTKKPELLLRHRKAWLDFTCEHQHWTLEDWKAIVWSDETKINMRGSDGR
ncbi:hypothetical protein FRB99_001987, partial [Tulasnella sp. 403]